MDLEQFEGHTPGPWASEHDDEDGEGHRILIGTRLHGIPTELDPAGRPLGYVGRCYAVHTAIEYLHGCEPCDEECGDCQDCKLAAEADANARLMAAAPDLLDEVKRLRKALLLLGTKAQDFIDGPGDGREAQEPLSALQEAIDSAMAMARGDVAANG